MTDPDRKKPMTYRDAGVDLEAQDEALRRIRAALAATRTKGVIRDMGAFGGMFRPDLAGLREPVLVSSCDGVGTKLRVAFDTGIHHTVGRDLVNHCVNDILVQGAMPLFFLDYVATGKLDPGVLASLVEGVASACRDAGCALIGGETAEMPGFYAPGHYELAGFIVGVADRSKIVDGSGIRPGDLLYGLASSGLHTNGYSLARKIFFEVEGLGVNDRVEELGGTVADVLLAVHRSYLAALREPVGRGLVRGLAHITGGGLTDNLPRILPEGTAARIERGTWTVPDVFRFLERAGGVSADDMYRVFNMGVGMVAVVAPENGKELERHLDEAGERYWRIGTVVPGEQRVVYA